VHTNRRSVLRGRAPIDATERRRKAPAAHAEWHVGRALDRAFGGDSTRRWPSRTAGYGAAASATAVNEAASLLASTRAIGRSTAEP
jgi:hypothetical protein